MTFNPTPEQIEAKQLAADLTRVAAALEEYEFQDQAGEAAGLMNKAAALVAAAGAAPQEAKPGRSKHISPSLPGMIRNLWKSDPSEASVRTALGLAGDLIQELIDLRAAPVQVDEAKLAEVERRAAEKAWNKLADVAFPLFEAAEAVLLADADKQTLMRPLANLGAQTNPYRRNEGENDVDMDVQRVR